MRTTTPTHTDTNTAPAVPIPEGLCHVRGEERWGQGKLIFQATTQLSTLLLLKHWGFPQNGGGRNATRRAGCVCLVCGTSENELQDAGKAASTNVSFPQNAPWPRIASLPPPPPPRESCRQQAGTHPEPTDQSLLRLPHTLARWPRS